MKAKKLAIVALVVLAIAGCTMQVITEPINDHAIVGDWSGLNQYGGKIAFIFIDAHAYGEYWYDSPTKEYVIVGKGTWRFLGNQFELTSSKGIIRYAKMPDGTEALTIFWAGGGFTLQRSKS